MLVSTWVLFDLELSKLSLTCLNLYRYELA